MWEKLKESYEIWALGLTDTADILTCFVRKGTGEISNISNSCTSINSAVITIIRITCAFLFQHLPTPLLLLYTPISLVPTEGIISNTAASSMALRFKS